MVYGERDIWGGGGWGVRDRSDLGGNGMEVEREGGE